MRRLTTRQRALSVIRESADNPFSSIRSYLGYRRNYINGAPVQPILADYYAPLNYHLGGMLESVQFLSDTELDAILAVSP
jgi:hypothetical protein